MPECFMFLPDETVLDQKKAIADQVEAGALTPEEAGEQIEAIDPDDHFNLFARGLWHQGRGEKKAAEQALWRAARAGPCSFHPYLALASMQTLDGPPGPLAIGLSALAFEKVLIDEERIREQLRQSGAPRLPSRREMEMMVASCAVLREQESGISTAEVCRRHGISSATFFKWKARFGGMDVSDARKLKALEDENGKLKRLLAEAMLDITMLKDLNAKMYDPPRPCKSLHADIEQFA